MEKLYCTVTSTLRTSSWPGRISVSATQWVWSSLVIDWIDASKGAPLSDVARTSILLTERNPERMTILNRIVFYLRDKFCQTYLNRYFQLRPEGRELLDAWVVCMAAARLWEGISDFEQHLISKVENGLTRL